MSGKYVTVLLMVLLIIGVVPETAQARPDFYQQIPANYEKSCNLCHVAPPILNDFGQKFKAAGFSFQKLDEADAQEANEVSTTGVQPKATDMATTLQLTMPPKASRGERIELVARLQDASSKPIAGAPISFATPTSLFMEGDMLISQALTDNNGVARIRYIPRLEEEIEIQASYNGSEGYQPAAARTELNLQGSTPIYNPDWSLKIPFLSPWLILLAVSMVWIAYAVTYNHLLAIRHLGLETEVSQEEKPREKKAIVR